MHYMILQMLQGFKRNEISSCPVKEFVLKYYMLSDYPGEIGKISPGQADVAEWQTHQTQNLT